jgi:hypothetical protein
MGRKVNESRDWKKASEECLTAVLNKAQELATNGETDKAKQLESLIKTVGDIVGASLYLNRAKTSGAASPEDDDE